MIVAFAFLMQAAAPSQLIVRSGALESDAPLVATAQGPAVKVGDLSPALPLDLHAENNGHFTIKIGDQTLDIADEMPFARSDSTLYPLASSPFIYRDELYVPLELVTELVPRLWSRATYDASRGELDIAPAEQQVAVLPTLIGTRRTPPRRGTTSSGSSTSRVGRTPRLVIVDAGHGGPDNGMNGPMGANHPIFEKDITLQVAGKLADALRSRAVDVTMTRTSDTLIALSDRGRIANARHGDLFVSVHVNAANPNWDHPERARGYETYFLSESKTEDERRVERMENEAVRFETNADPGHGDPLSFVINDMAQNEHLRESADLAQTVQKHLGMVEPGPSRGVKQAGFRVLVTAYMPAILVEIGFGTNADEMAFISNPKHQREIAGAIADAVVEYLDQYEQRVGSATP